MALLFIIVVILTAILLIYTYFKYPKYFSAASELIGIAYIAWVVLERAVPK